MNPEIQDELKKWAARLTALAECEDKIATAEKGVQRAHHNGRATAFREVAADMRATVRKAKHVGREVKRT